MPQGNVHVWQTQTMVMLVQIASHANDVYHNKYKDYSCDICKTILLVGKQETIRDLSHCDNR